MLQTVSHVLFPCGRQPFIYTFVSRLRFISLRQAPLPNLGFSLAGFTRSTAPVSRHARLCGTFKAFFPWRAALGTNAAVRNCPARIYGFIRHKHYSHRRLCEHGLSSDAIGTSDCLTHSVYFLNTSYSRRERRFRISTCDCGGIVSPSAPTFASSSAIFAFSCST